MGNCATNQRIEESESDTCYVFKVDKWDSTKSPVICGTLKVMESGLEFTSQDKDEIIECTWHHVRQFACDGKAFTCSVRHDHAKEREEYWFSCENVAVLFLRVNNYFIRVKESEEQKKDGTSEDNVSEPFSPGMEEQVTRSKKLQSSKANAGSGCMKSSSSRTSTPKFRMAVMHDVSNSRSPKLKEDRSENKTSGATLLDIENMEMVAENSSTYAHSDTCASSTSLEQGTSFVETSDQTCKSSLGTESRSSAVLSRSPKSTTCDERASGSRTRKKPSTSRSHRKKKGSRGSSKSGCGSVRSMSPLLETADNASRVTSSSDGNQTNRSQSSSYVNLTPYINVTPADSPLPPPLPPKGIKPSSFEENSEEESLDGLCGVSCNSDVFLPATDAEKEEIVDDLNLTRQLSSATVTCTLCIDKPKAVTYCYACQAFVCSECAKQHLRMAIFANHNLFVRESDSPVARRKSTGSMLTIVKYTDVIFQEASEEQSPHSDPEPFNQSKLRHKRSLSCGGKDFAKVDYSKIDLEKTKELSKLKRQRMRERSWNTKERRASMGNRHTSKVQGSN